MTEGLTDKQRMFVEEYLVDFNATQAAIRAGYSEKTASVIGYENLRKPQIQQAIQDKVMSREETLLRLTDLARGDLADVFDITSMGFVVDLAKAQQGNKTKLIKRVRQTVTTVHGKDEDREIVHLEVEIHDPLTALDKIARYHKLLTERVESSGLDGKPAEVVVYHIPDNGRGDGGHRTTEG